MLGVPYAAFMTTRWTTFLLIALMPLGFGNCTMNIQGSPRTPLPVSSHVEYDFLQPRGTLGAYGHSSLDYLEQPQCGVAWGET